MKAVFAARSTAAPAGSSGVDGLGRRGGDRRGGLLRGRGRRDFLRKGEGEGDFLGDGRLFLADADLALESGEGRLEALRLDGEVEHVAGAAHAVAAHALAGGEENGAVIDGLAGLADL